MRMMHMQKMGVFTAALFLGVTMLPLCSFADQAASSQSAYQSIVDIAAPSPLTSPTPDL
jgi:hypothetical protein